MAVHGRQMRLLTQGTSADTAHHGMQLSTSTVISEEKNRSKSDLLDSLIGQRSSDNTNSPSHEAPGGEGTAPHTALNCDTCNYRG